MLWQLLTILIFLFSASAKVKEGYIKVPANQSDVWHPLSKFIMGVGLGSYNLSLDADVPSEDYVTKEVLKMNLLIYTYDTWDDDLVNKSCEEQVRHSVYNKPIDVPLNGSLLKLKQQPIGQDQHTQVWYFVVSNCFIGNPNERDVNIRFRLVILNSDGGHLSEESRGLLPVLGIMMFIGSIYLLKNLKDFHEFYFDGNPIDYTDLFLLVLLAIQIISLGFKAVDLYMHSVDGKGHFFFKIAGVSFSNAAEAFMSVAFVALAAGLAVDNLGKEKRHRLLVAVIIIALISFYGSMFSHYSKTGLENFHDYNNFAGGVFVISRVFIWLHFIWEVKKSWKSCDEHLRTYYRNLAIFGSIYLLSFPIAVFLSNELLPPYLRHRVITGCTILTQSIAIIQFFRINWESGQEYFPVILQNNEILPVSKIT